LLVLSPHRDDAAFSLALSLKRWITTGAEIDVLNFFTRSGYAPYACEGADIPAVRASEDARALRALDKRIRLRSLPLLDAPLRLPIDFGSITNPDVFSPLAEEVEGLARTIRRVSRLSLILAPLALGEHIDHRTVRDAAFASADPKRIAFYEDLPYAAWTPESAQRQRVSEIERRLRVSLFPARQHSHDLRWKGRIVRLYRSQIDDRMTELIARYGEKYAGAERIWAPRHDARWRMLLSDRS
jgi:LmbE family N-acetylglucosaminyl deacetylase